MTMAQQVKNVCKSLFYIAKSGVKTAFLSQKSIQPIVEPEVAVAFLR